MRVNVDALALEAVESYRAQQKPRELAELGRMILGHKLSTAAEIGTYDGGTAWFWNALGLDVVTVDIDQSHAHRVPGVRYIQGSSHSAQTWLSPSDFLFIDGDHSYAGVASDFRDHSHSVRPGGLVAFHDIVEHPPELHCEVHQFWQEIKTKHVTVEIFDPVKPEWGGIGCLIPR